MPTQNNNAKVIIRGKVKQFQSETRGNALNIWRFLVIQFDEKNNQLPPVPVEFKGVEINGIINVGDDVEVFGKKNSSGLLSASKIHNHTSNSLVQAKQNKGCLVLVILIFLVFIIVMFAAFFHGK